MASAPPRFERPSEAHPPAWFAWTALALALASGIYGLAFWMGRDRGPPAESFAPAAAALRAAYRDGDLIFLVPAFATRAREHLGDLHPLAVTHPLAEDLRTHPRFWVFGLFGYAEMLRDDFEQAGNERVDTLETPPGITIDLYETPRHQSVEHRFIERLEDASVAHQHSDGTLEPCDRWQATNHQGGKYGRWTCPHDGDWFYVAPEWHRMGDHLRLCFWAHPPNEGRLLIQFPNVPLTGELHGFGGHTLNSSLYARERIDLEVAIGDARPQKFAFRLEEHWRPFALTTPTSTTATVTFAVSTPDAGANHFCFTAEMREP